MKYFLFRQKLDLPLDLPRQLQFRIAQTPEEYKAAGKIIYDCYREKDYTGENEAGLRLIPQHFLPTTVVLVALWENEIIGTMTLIRDNPLGLPMESIFDLKALRIDNAVLCEVSSLAIKKSFRGNKGHLFFPFTRFMWNYALKYFGVDYLVIAVNPAMSELYESIYLFEPIHENKTVGSYDFANGNPAVGEYIHLPRSVDFFKKKYGTQPNKKNFYEFMVNPDRQREFYPERKYFTFNDSPVKLDWLNQFASVMPEIKNNNEIKQAIARSYGFKNMLSDKQNESARVRVPVLFHIDNCRDLKIVDLSETGIKLSGVMPDRLRKLCSLECLIGPDEKAKIIIEPAWESHNQIGCRIKSNCPGWDKMLKSIFVENLNLNQRAA
jgi:hypothetical protein